ncbi:hypothetical protein BDF22DRAFT_739148 [Syncephalis plumigaleata]|nr:hypothetical protein BDF22DRAFT_739148 [Syncephalis plumigaleata]
MSWRRLSWLLLAAIPLVQWWQPVDATPQSFYNVTGALIYPRFDDTKTCTLQAGFFLNSRLTKQDFNASIVTFDWSVAEQSGCQTIAQAATAVFNYALTLSTTNAPPVHLFLLQLSKLVKGYSGGPETEDYLSGKASIPDGTPKVKTALLPAEKAEELHNFMVKLINQPTVTIVQELGPWNKIFRSPAYMVISFFFLTMNAVFLMFSFYRLYHVIRKKEFKFESRNIIYVTGVLAAIVTIAHIPLQKQTLVRFVLSQCSALLSALAFYGLLLLWSNIFEMTRRRKELQLLNYLVYFAMLLQLVAFISQLADTLANQPAWMQLFLSIIFWAMPATQILISGVYIYYIYIFSKQQQEIFVSKQTIYALRWLSSLAIAGMFSFVLAMVANVINAVGSLRGSPSAWAVQYQLQDLWRTIRIVALLLIMGIRIPKPMAHDQLNSSGEHWHTSKTAHSQASPYTTTPWPAV